jgi:hypothetical protein
MLASDAHQAHGKSHQSKAGQATSQQPLQLQASTDASLTFAGCSDLHIAQIASCT